MDKKILLEQIQSFRPNEIKIEGKVTKVELIRGIFEQEFEQSSTKDMMELLDEEKEGVGVISRDPELQTQVREEPKKSSDDEKEKEKEDDKKKKPKEKIPKPPKEEPEEQVEEPAPDEEPVAEEPSGERVQGTGLRFATDLGFKAVALNDEFKKMSEPKEITLKSMFTAEQLKKIIKTSPQKWESVTPNTFYCGEKDTEVGGAPNDFRIPCWRTSDKGKVRFPFRIEKGLLTNYYTRQDEKGGEKRYVNKETGARWIPMGPRSPDVNFNILPLDGNHNAVSFTLPNSDDVYLANMKTNKVNFLFDKEKTAEAPAPARKPEAKVEPKPKSNDDRAGDLLLDVR